MTIVHIGELEAPRMQITVSEADILSVAFKSDASPEAKEALVASFEALAQQCLHPETNKPYITSLKAGRQNSPEGRTKGLDLIFVLEFEVGLSTH